MDAFIASSAAAVNTATNFVCFLKISVLNFFFLHYELIIFIYRKSSYEWYARGYGWLEVQVLVGLLDS